MHKFIIVIWGLGMGIGDWGLGIGPNPQSWGLGIGDWAQSPIPNPQTPNPMKLTHKLITYIKY